MLKRLMVLLAALAAAFTLAVGPASANHGNLQMWDTIQQDENTVIQTSTDLQAILTAQGPSNCTNIGTLSGSPNDMGEARAVVNNSSFEIRFFSELSCAGSNTRLVGVDQTDPDIYTDLGNLSGRSFRVEEVE